MTSSSVDKTKIIEVGDSIGLRPETDASLCECFVAKVEYFFLVKENLYVTSRHRHTQLVPVTHIYNMIEVIEKLTNALYDSIDPNILFQRIGPGEVVVSVIRRTPDETTAHIGLSING